MNDERPFERLAMHAGPAEVDKAFGDGLYAVLQREMGRPQPSIGRILLLVAAALLVAATVTGAVVVGSGLVHPPWVNRLQLPAASTEASPLVEPSPTPSPSRRPSGGWTLTASMITPYRIGSAVTLLPDGTVLVAGGADGSTDESEPFRSAELFDPASDSWVSTGSMFVARTSPTATLLSDGTVLVAGGSSGGGQGALKSAELYDAVTGTWTATGDMIQARSGHTATLLSDGRVLVAGGDHLASAELYDPLTGTWAATGDMTQARDGQTATLLSDGRVLVAGGSAELYDPANDTWTATADMTEPYYGHTATLLLDGTVLVAGGDAPSGPGARAWPHAEVYDPISATWRAVAPLVTPRLESAATLLPDGRVLVSGGREHGGADSALLHAAELYDPGTGRWFAIGDMVAAHSGHSAVLLPDGRVLIVGGEPSDLQASAELYDPATP